MIGNIVLVVIAASLFLLPATSTAQQSTKKTTAKNDSKLVLDMPGLNDGREIFEYLGWDSAYKIERSYAAQVKRNANYPRAQVYLYVLRPGYIWTRENTVDEASIKVSIPFLKDRAITIETADQGGQNRTLPHVRTRFSVDGAKCIWFKALEGGMGGGATSAYAGGNYEVSGFYCGAVGQPLSDSDIQAVLKGWRYVPNPPGPSVATAPAAPPSAPAASTPAAPATAVPLRTATVAVNWDGRLMAGTLEYADTPNSGTLKLVQSNAVCNGTWRHLQGKYDTANPPQGMWAIACGDGQSATGTYKSDRPANIVGDGQDARGKRVEIRTGE